MKPARSEPRPGAVAFVLLAALVPGLAAPAGAAGLGDDEIVERRLLPREVKQQVAALAAARGAAVSSEPGRAAALARAFLRRARTEGDPRLVGYAEAVLQPWAARAEAPDEVVVLLATVEQAQHRFDAARQRLERLLQGRREPLPQARLTLSTVRAVQGDLAGARAACTPLVAASPTLAALCTAQVQVQTAEAEAALPGLQALASSADPATAHWAASLAGETLARLGRTDEALPWLAQAARSGELYDALALADALLAAGRLAPAAAALAGLPPTDAVLLRQWRLARLDPQAAPEQAERLRARLAERFAQADPAEAQAHARERALFHLWGDEVVEAARWARRNLALQREPIDLRIAAEAALRAGDEPLKAEVQRLREASGLQDRRLVQALRPGQAGHASAALTP